MCLFFSLVFSFPWHSAGPQRVIDSRYAERSPHIQPASTVCQQDFTDSKPGMGALFFILYKSPHLSHFVHTHTHTHTHPHVHAHTILPSTPHQWVRSEERSWSQCERFVKCPPPWIEMDVRFSIQGTYQVLKHTRHEPTVLKTTQCLFSVLFHRSILLAWMHKKAFIDSSYFFYWRSALLCH